MACRACESCQDSVGDAVSDNLVVGRTHGGDPKSGRLRVPTQRGGDAVNRGGKYL